MISGDYCNLPLYAKSEAFFRKADGREPCPVVPPREASIRNLSRTYHTQARHLTLDPASKPLGLPHPGAPAAASTATLPQRTLAMPAPPAVTAPFQHRSQNTDIAKVLKLPERLQLPKVEIKFFCGTDLCPPCPFDFFSTPPHYGGTKHYVLRQNLNQRPKRRIKNWTLSDGCLCAGPKSPLSLLICPTWPLRLISRKTPSMTFSRES